MPGTLRTNELARATEETVPLYSEEERSKRADIVVIRVASNY